MGQLPEMTCTLFFVILGLAVLCVRGDEVMPCTGSQVLFVQSTDEYDPGSERYCTTNRTGECDGTPSLPVTHWLFDLNGTYSSTDPPVDLCVREDHSLLAILPSEGLSESFTVKYAPADDPGTSQDLEIEYFPAGFYLGSQGDFVDTEGEGILNVWRSVGVCRPEVLLCEQKNGEQPSEHSGLFEIDFDVVADCGANKQPFTQPFTYALTINREISPEDSGNYTLFLADGDCSDDDHSDPVTVSVSVPSPVTTAATSPEPTSSSAPTTDSPSSEETNFAAIVVPIAGVVAIFIFVLVVVFLVIYKLRHRDRKPTTEEGGVDQTDEPGGSPPPIARSPVQPNPYLHLGPVTEHLPASSPDGVELKSVSPAPVPASNIRSIAVVSDGSGKWDESLRDKLVQRHEACEKAVDLASHSEDLQECVYAVLFDPCLDWFYVIWRGSLEQKLKDDQSEPVSLWRLVSELKSFPLPDDQRKKIVLVQLGASTTTNHTNGVLTLYIRTDSTEEYSEEKAADDIYKEMEDRDRERRRERTQRAQTVPSDHPVSKGWLNRLRKSEPRWKSDPMRRKQKEQKRLVSDTSKSVSASTDRLPHCTATTAAVNGGENLSAASSAAHVDHLKDIKEILKESTVIMEKGTQLAEKHFKLAEEQFVEQRRHRQVTERVADNTGESRDLHRQQMDKHQEDDYRPDSESDSEER